VSGIRARRRPRKKSVNFRRLRWVLVREAAVRIIAPDLAGDGMPHLLRFQLTRRDTYAVAKLAGVVLALHPERQVWPLVPS
jgi:hypothetical protein